MEKSGKLLFMGLVLTTKLSGIFPEIVIRQSTGHKFHEFMEFIPQMFELVQGRGGNQYSDTPGFDREYQLIWRGVLHH